jgi:hypothetical protein
MLLKKVILTIESGTIIRGEKESCGTYDIASGSKIMVDENEKPLLVFKCNTSESACTTVNMRINLTLGNSVINRVRWLSRNKSKPRI